jgi:hypothetical protein
VCGQYGGGVAAATPPPSMSNALPDDGVTAPKHVGASFNANFNVNIKFFLSNKCTIY